MIKIFKIIYKSRLFSLLFLFILFFNLNLFSFNTTLPYFLKNIGKIEIKKNKNNYLFKYKNNFKLFKTNNLIKFEINNGFDYQNKAILNQEMFIYLNFKF